MRNEWAESGTVTEGQLATLTANVNLPNTAFTLTVDWGTGQSTETYSFPALAQNIPAVQINYYYTDPDPTHAPTYGYTVTVTSRPRA